MHRCLAAIPLLAVSCGGAPDSSGALPPIEPPALTDINPDPGVVEVRLVAAPATFEYLTGKPAAVWAYRDEERPDAPVSIPGPVLRARQGDEIVVHFRNDLPDATTVHWHGLRLPAAADGSTSTQRPVRPGESYVYRFRARDAGTFWYHPHVAADVQIERGLYGLMVVTGGVQPDVTAERYFALDDVKLLADGTLSAVTDDLDRMLGRQGNVLLVNGHRQPGIDVARGSRERWRFVNAANGRYFNLRLGGLRFLVIGGDGGLVPRPYETETLLVAPGERYEVLVSFDGSAADTRLETIHYDRGHDIPDPGPRTLMDVRMGPAAGTPLGPLPSFWREDLPPAVDGATPVRPFTLTESDGPAGPAFFINGQRWPLNTPVNVRHGDVEIWELRNETKMDHPFHLHGMFFRVLASAAGEPRPGGWKDTVNVPRESRVRFVVGYETPGTWMFHCHILEHAELGMMGDLMVSDDPSQLLPPGHEHPAQP